LQNVETMHHGDAFYVAVNQTVTRAEQLDCGGGENISTRNARVARMVRACDAEPCPASSQGLEREVSRTLKLLSLSGNKIVELLGLTYLDVSYNELDKMQLVSTLHALEELQLKYVSAHCGTVSCWNYH
jgi:hypothetical protein